MSNITLPVKSEDTGSDQTSPGIKKLAFATNKSPMASSPTIVVQKTDSNKDSAGDKRSNSPLKIDLSPVAGKIKIIEAPDNTKPKVDVEKEGLEKIVENQKQLISELMSKFSLSMP